MITIEPLEKKYLEPAIHINQKIFPTNYVDPRESIEASLDPVKMAEFERILKKLDEPLTRYLMYWVAVDENQKVLGTTGIYERVGDPQETCWLGWFAVDPESRGKGIGSQLLDFTLQKARENGSKTMLLYTSTDPKETRAHEMYKRRGFFQRDDLGRMPEGEYEIFYMECKL